MEAGQNQIITASDNDTVGLSAELQPIPTTIQIPSGIHLPRRSSEVDYHNHLPSESLSSECPTRQYGTLVLGRTAKEPEPAASVPIRLASFASTDSIFAVSVSERRQQTSASSSIVSFLSDGEDGLFEHDPPFQLRGPVRSSRMLSLMQYLKQFLRKLMLFFKNKILFAKRKLQLIKNWRGLRDGTAVLNLSF